MSNHCFAGGSAEMWDRSHTVCLIFPAHSRVLWEKGVEGASPAEQQAGVPTRCGALFWAQVSHRCYWNLFSDAERWHNHQWYAPQALVWCEVGAIFLFTLKALQCCDRHKYAETLKMSKSTCSVAKKPNKGWYANLKVSYYTWCGKVQYLPSFRFNVNFHYFPQIHHESLLHFAENMFLTQYLW